MEQVFQTIEKIRTAVPIVQQKYSDISSLFNESKFDEMSAEKKKMAEEIYREAARQREIALNGKTQNNHMIHYVNDLNDMLQKAYDSHAPLISTTPSSTPMLMSGDKEPNSINNNRLVESDGVVATLTQTTNDLLLDQIKNQQLYEKFTQQMNDLNVTKHEYELKIDELEQEKEELKKKQADLELKESLIEKKQIQLLVNVSQMCQTFNNALNTFELEKQEFQLFCEHTLDSLEKIHQMLEMKTKNKNYQKTTASLPPVQSEKVTSPPPDVAPVTTININTNKTIQTSQIPKSSTLVKLVPVKRKN